MRCRHAPLGDSPIDTWSGTNGRGNCLGGLATFNGNKRRDLVRSGHHLRTHDSECNAIRKPSKEINPYQRLVLTYCGARTVSAMALSTLLLLSLAGCNTPDPLQQEILTLQERTMPPGAQLVERTNLTRDGYTARASWEYETDWNWDKYATWISDNLAANYQVVTREQMRLEFRRPLPADVFQLQIEMGMSNGARRVRVNFRAYPD